jgi:hypothetical protein
MRVILLSQFDLRVKTILSKSAFTVATSVVVCHRYQGKPLGNEYRAVHVEHFVSSLLFLWSHYVLLLLACQHYF